MFKVLIIINLILILLSLAFGGVFLAKDSSQQNRVAIALTVRITLSITLLLLLISGYFMGYISPNSLFQ